MSKLQRQLREIVNGFVSSVLDVMSKRSVLELAGDDRRGHSEASRRSLVRRPRATAAEVQRQKDVVLVTVKMLAPGFRKRDVMKRSSSPVDLGRALSLLAREGKLTRKGTRRAARYWVVT